MSCEINSCGEAPPSAGGEARPCPARLTVEAKRRQAPEERPGAVTVTAGPLGRSTKPSRGPLHPPSAAAT